jgi:ribosomal-protein-alanine N-acetyltransferase
MYPNSGTDPSGVMPPFIPCVTTERLTLRSLRLADAPALQRIYQLEGVLTYFPDTSPPPLERIERFVAGQEEHWLEHGYGNWGIVPKGETELIGWAGLQFLSELNETEVGFLLSPHNWGKGYATEAARASCRFGFEGFDLDHLIALVHPDNAASRRVINKCGVRYLETIHLWGIDLMKYRLDRP